MTIDWNPNVINQLHPVQEIEGCLRRCALGDDRAPDLLKMAVEFTAAYKTARQMAGHNAALAYRLDLAAEPAPKDLDPMAPMQLGGLPDLTNDINQSAAHAVHLKEKPNLKALVDRYWPMNQMTGQPLKFLCQLDVYYWMAVIHYLTFEIWADEDCQKNHAQYYWFSGAGGQRFFEWPHRLQVWYDPDYREGFLGANAFMLAANSMLPQESLFTKEEIAAAVQEKNAEANQVSYASNEELPRLRLAPPKIGFDIEEKENGLSYVSDKLRDKLEGNPLFNGASEITLFGRASSQQEPRRFVNPYPEHPHRLTPFLCWNSRAHDVTYQICAALKTFNIQWVECKVDSSCT